MRNAMSMLAASLFMLSAVTCLIALMRAGFSWWLAAIVVLMLVPVAKEAVGHDRRA